MLQRMEKSYTDTSYEDPALIVKYEQFEAKVNVNASALVIICINKMYQLMFDYGLSLAKGETEINTKSIRKLFVHCSKIYIADQMLFVAMNAPKDDLFY